MSLRCWVLFLSTHCQTTIKWASYSHTGSRVRLLSQNFAIWLSDTPRSVTQYSLSCLSSSYWAGLAPLCPDIRRVSRVVPMSMTDHGPCLGIRNDNERNHTYRIRDWKCCWTFHVEKGLPTTVFLAYSTFIKPSYRCDRNHVPWAVISACMFACLLLLLLLRFMLASENQRRGAEQRDERYDVVYIAQELPDGTRLEKRVDKAFLDLTDIQNRDFRFAL